MAGVPGRSGVYQHERAPVCRRGHPTVWRQNSTRWGRCKLCNTIQQRENRARKKAQAEYEEVARQWALRDAERQRRAEERQRAKDAADLKALARRLHEEAIEAEYARRREAAMRAWARRVREGG